MSLMTEIPCESGDPFGDGPRHGRVWTAAIKEPFGRGTFSGTAYAEACSHYASILTYAQPFNTPEELQAMIIRHMAIMDARAKTMTSAYRIAAGEEEFSPAIVGISEELGEALTRSAALALTVADLYGAEETTYAEALDRACWLAHQTQATFRDIGGRWGTLKHGVPSRLQIERYLPAHAVAALDGLARGYRDNGGSLRFLDPLDSHGW